MGADYHDGENRFLCETGHMTKSHCRVCEHAARSKDDEPCASCDKIRALQERMAMEDRMGSTFVEEDIANVERWCKVCGEPAVTSEGKTSRTSYCHRCWGDKLAEAKRHAEDARRAAKEEEDRTVAEGLGMVAGNLEKQIEKLEGVNDGHGDDGHVDSHVGRGALRREPRGDLVDAQGQVDMPSGVAAVMPGHPGFHSVLARMAEIHSAKNMDYGNGKPLGNFEASRDLGVAPWLGALVRMSDKWSRVKSLANKAGQRGVSKDESFEDTLLDLANYAVLTLILYSEEKSR